MIESIRYCRENKIPLFGICLGMQMSVVEFARNVAGLEGANSTEFEETEYPVIDIMDSQKDITEKGGTMRLGLYPCKLQEGSRCKDIYGKDLIYERHRHRWEFNNRFKTTLTSKGLVIGGIATMIMVSSMRSVHRQTGASDYKKPNSFKLDLSQDTYLYNKIEKVQISQPSQNQNNNH